MKMVYALVIIFAFHIHVAPQNLQKYFFVLTFEIIIFSIQNG